MRYVVAPLMDLLGHLVALALVAGASYLLYLDFGLSVAVAFFVLCGLVADVRSLLQRHFSHLEREP